MIEIVGSLKAGLSCDSARFLTLSVGWEARGLMLTKFPTLDLYFFTRYFRFSM